MSSVSESRAASPSPLTFERDGHIATLTLNRPDRGNAIDVDLARALMYAAIACDEDDEIRCVVLTGSGKLFCAGGDIGSFAAAGDGIPTLIKELTAYLHAAIARFARMNKPLLTAANGPAAGAGLSLLLLGDIALATRSAHFSLAYTAIGLSPDGGSTWLLPRLIGLRRAQEMALLNERLSADEAATLGLVTRTIDDDAFAGETKRMAQRLSAAATAALGRTRSLLLASFSSTFETQMELEARAVAEASRGAESREGIDAFKNKRRARFER